ncbi:MAG: alpha/beta hydrolase [Acidimicrobiaceae bacterium]|nr:alpha/beta hydrolase [Acidimicrobiaceae bacterium]MYF43789.1 alpha/beta hydrolase [Acidimicrobiaceae bacterium]
MPMTRLDWRLRLLSRIPMFNPDHTTMTAADRARARRQRPPRLLLGWPDSNVSTRYMKVPSTNGRLRMRIDEPAVPRVGLRPLVVYVHGGGWMFGDLDTPEWLTTRLATGIGAVVVSIGYSLAPEHPFPAAVEDCWAALEWIAEHSSTLRADTQRVAIAGDSAGGNLAAVLCITARDRGGPPICHQTLICPALDLTWSSPSIDTEANHRIIPRQQLDAVRAAYIGAADPTDWRISPLHADDLRGMPAAHILVAEHDTLRDDGIRYAKRLRADSVPVRLSTYIGMAHGFLGLSLTPTIRRQALADVIGELTAAFSAR